MIRKTYYRNVSHLLLLVLIAGTLSPAAFANQTGSPAAGNAGTVTSAAPADQAGSAGTIEGTVVDPTAAVVAAATVTIENSVTNFKRTVTTDQTGTFRFENVPPNNYKLSASAEGFQPNVQTVTVRSSVPLAVKVELAIVGASNSITVEASSNTLENVPSTHTDIDQSLMGRLVLSTPGSGLSDAIAQSAPGVVQDSNGQNHPLGDHAETTISLDNQTISDQQSKAFSTSLPVNAIQSMEATTAGVPAEYGGKTSLVINAISRSGLGQKTPTGSFNSSYGTFGTTQDDATFGFGSAKFGTFTAFNFERSGRFLDAPEFTVLHDRGLSASLFERLDYSPGSKDTFHLNLILSRNHFQIPNQFDQQAAGQDQSQLVRSINIAAGWVHTFSQTTVLTVNPSFRLDQIWYVPSANPFADLPETVSQQRRLNNVGFRADLSYVKGIHNAKFGVQVSHTFLTEAFQFGITDPAFNAPGTAGFLPGLTPFDLTRGGQLFSFNGHTDVKQEAAYIQDAITSHGATLSVGLRFDNYDAISHGHLLQPRVGFSYLVKPTGTVLRGAFTRSLETPYNENLILSSATGAGGLATNGALGATTQNALQPGTRNQYDVGVQQSIGKHIVIDADYFWKFTHNAYDFNALLSTPITFPISWNQSKIDGVSMRLNLSAYKGLSAFFVAGHTRARFFPPETGGLIFNSDLPTGVFRIDHDQAFESTAQVQYQFEQIKKLAPYIAMTWRYDSGGVAGAVPDLASTLTLTPDQQAQIGLSCGGVFATPTQGFTGCNTGALAVTRVVIPATGTENDDHNPPRIAPRNLFDLSLGTDNLLRTEHTRMTLRLTAVNLTNKDSLYNFLSTFSGTHFVSPRTFQAQIGVVF